MTTDAQRTPTDDEIDELWRFEASKNWDSTLAMRTRFARAVLARWGQPDGEHTNTEQRAYYTTHGGSTRVIWVNKVSRRV